MYCPAWVGWPSEYGAGWLLDLESTELIEGADGRPDPVKLKEAQAVAKRLEAMADRLESKG